LIAKLRVLIKILINNKGSAGPIHYHENIKILLAQNVDEDQALYGSHAPGSGMPASIPDTKPD
jgi:hypothetical protein